MSYEGSIVIFISDSIVTPDTTNTESRAFKVLFETGKSYDAIVIPSDSVGTMVIPLSIHPEEIETLSTISYRKNVHRLILSSRSPFFRKLFDRRTDCPLGHISLVVLDSSIIPSHLLKSEISFNYLYILRASAFVIRNWRYNINYIIDLILKRYSFLNVDSIYVIRYIR